MRVRQLTKKSYYGGGYNKSKQLELDAIKFPERLGCTDCGKLQPLWKFSEINQKALRKGIACRQVDPNKLDQESWIKCVNCTGKQVTELECCVCERVKGLEGFTKAQRRNPDNARCIECVAYHQDDLTDEEDDGKGKGREDDNETASVSNVYENDSFDGESEVSGGALLQSQGGSQARSQGDLNAINLENLNIATGTSSPGVSTRFRSSLASDNDSGSKATIKDARSNFADLAALGPRRKQVKPEPYAGRTVDKYNDSDDDDDDDDEFRYI